MFIPCYLPCVVLVTFGGGKGVAYSEMVLVNKEKDCGLSMWNQVL